MRISLVEILRFVVRPHGIVTVTVLLSMTAWLLPDLDIIRKGFDSPQNVFSFGGLTVFVWYGAIIFLSWLFFRFGQLSERLIDSFDVGVPLDDFIAYCFLSTVGFIGFLYVAWFMISNLGFYKMLLAVGGGEANILHKTLYADYTVGLFSLRYVVILSGGLAIYRLISRLSHSLLDLANILMLLLVAVIASRLSVVFAMMIGFGLFALNTPKIKIRIGRWIILLLAVFVIFSLYNYSRNINYYLGQGNAGFFSAGFSEIIKYLASPFQGALAAGNFPREIMAHPQDSYLYTGINPLLSTNSAFLGMMISNGWLFIPIMAASIIISAFVMGMLYNRRKNYLILIYLVLLYCFAEIWRVYIFRGGIISTLLIFSLLTPYASIAIKALIKYFKYTSPPKGEGTDTA